MTEPASLDDAEARRRAVQALREDQSPTWRRGIFHGSSVPSTHGGGWEQRHWTSRLLSRLSEVVAHSAAGAVASLFVLMWVGVGLVEDFPPWWKTVLYSVTGSITFVMVFVIQHTQQRQTAATQRKLDELLRSSDAADKSVIAVEESPDEDLAALASLNLADRDEATAR